MIPDEGDLENQSTSKHLPALTSGTATTTFRVSFADSGDEGGVDATLPGPSQQRGTVILEAENLAVCPFVARKWGSVCLTLLI